MFIVDDSYLGSLCIIIYIGTIVLFTWNLILYNEILKTVLSTVLLFS